jgi:hypothetical protein
MTPLTALWLPILLSAVFVFIASSIIHMTPLWHKGDFPKLANEDAVMNALRPLALPPGDYLIPRPGSGAEMRSPEFKEKVNKGPVVLMTVMPNGMMSMTRNLVLWFFFILAVSFASAYIAAHAVPPGSYWHGVFRFAGATAFLGYAVALWEMSIWYRRAWSMTIKSTVDGVIYAAITAATFAWLWPR